MLYLIKDGKKLKETKSETIREIIDHIQTYTEIDCDYHTGQDGLIKFCENYNLRGSCITEILNSFNLKETDFENTVFEINCYDSFKSFKDPIDFINNAKAFVFKEKGTVEEYNISLASFFGDKLKIEGTEEF